MLLQSGIWIFVVALPAGLRRLWLSRCVGCGFGMVVGQGEAATSCAHKLRTCRCWRSHCGLLVHGIVASSQRSIVAL